VKHKHRHEARAEQRKHLGGHAQARWRKSGGEGVCVCVCLSSGALSRTVANVFRMLPAYLITTAVSIAPANWMKTTAHVLALKPCIMPSASTASRSVWRIATACSGIEKSASCMLRMKRELPALVNTSSR